MTPVEDVELGTGAQWIWHPPVEKMHNFHLLARNVFSLGGEVIQATCLISANNAYELYINSDWIGRGPVRSYPEWQYYDEYDVAQALCPGDNVIAVHAYNHGEEHPGYMRQAPGPGGLIVKLVVRLGDDSEVVVVTDESWCVLRAPQYNIDTGFITGHREDYKEVYDANKEPTGWHKLEFDDSDWQPAHVFGPGLTEPFTHLLPREIPFFTSEPVWPTNAFGHLSGCAYGFTEHDITNPQAITRDNKEVAEILPLNDDFEVQIILDFGRPIVGRFHLDVANCSGGEIFISYGDSLNLTRTDRLTLRSGSQHYQPYERRFGQYVMLTCRNLTAPLRLRGAWFELVTYPVQELGEFACNDPMLNRIWDVGRWTLRMNMHDHYEDCPWREQTLFLGDLRVSALLAYYAYGDYALARHSIIKMARLQTEEGVVPVHGPVPPNMILIPEYPALWLIAIEDYWRHSGDLSLVAELWDNIKRLLGWYHSWHDEHGLMKQLPAELRYDFVDNLAGVNMSGQMLAVQSLYHRALEAAVTLAEAVKDTAIAQVAREHAHQLATAINQLYWDAAQQAYIDSLTSDVNASSEVNVSLNQITNGLMLYCGLVPPERQTGTLSVLLNANRAPAVKAGYMNYYMTEALFTAGQPVAAIQRIREYWGSMIEHGATAFWEVYDSTTPSGEYPDRLWSLCHVFCAGPVHSLPAHVLGVQPLEAGFRRILIAPEPGDLCWARGVVPTPKGPVKVDWQRADDGIRFDLEVSWPAGITVDLVMPTYRRDQPRVELDGATAEFERAPGKALLHLAATDERQEHRIVTF